MNCSSAQVSWDAAQLIVWDKTRPQTGQGNARKSQAKARYRHRWLNLICVEADGIQQPKRVETLRVPGMQVQFNLRKTHNALGHMIWCSDPCFRFVFNWTSTPICGLTSSGVCFPSPCPLLSRGRVTPALPTLTWTLVYSVLSPSPPRQLTARHTVGTQGTPMEVIWCLL